jgi:hypothetical protein
VIRVVEVVAELLLLEKILLLDVQEMQEMELQVQLMEHQLKEVVVVEVDHQMLLKVMVVEVVEVMVDIQAQMV